MSRVERKEDTLTDILDKRSTGMQEDSSFKTGLTDDRINRVPDRHDKDVSDLPESALPSIITTKTTRMKWVPDYRKAMLRPFMGVPAPHH